MKRSLPSVSDFAELINENFKSTMKFPLNYGKFVASTASSVSSLMSSSKGRDKICSIIQYHADFYLACVKYTNLNEVKILYEYIL